MENKVSDDKKATERLANERTFLAWMRTSISVISLGFVISRFSLWIRDVAPGISGQAAVHPGSGLSEPVGIAMIGMGGLLTIAAAWRFHVVDRQIDEGKVRADRGLVVIVTAATAALTLLTMFYIGLTSAAES